MFSVHTRLLILTLLLTLVTGTAFAQTAITNTDKSAKGLKTATLKEVWRAGGEDDEVFFGTIGNVRTDSKGNIYLLDGQLSESHIYSPDGEHLATVGREGDGPGEVRNPSDMFITDDGTVHLLQGFPGRVVKLTPDGLPAGEATFGAGPDAAGQFAVLIGGRTDGKDMILAGIRMTFGGAISKQTYFLARCDDNAQQKVALLEKLHEINYADFKMDELEMDFIWSRLAVGPEGLVYAGPERNEYLINVYAADGSIIRTIGREYESAPRTDRQRQVATQIIEAVAANYPTPPNEITIEDTEPVIGNMSVTDDGRLWVQTSHGNHHSPDGTFVVLDVFDPSGKFEKQVALKGNHDASRDAINILPDGRIVMVVGALDAWLNQQGAADEEEDGEEGDPLEVICYEVEF